MDMSEQGDQGGQHWHLCVPEHLINPIDAMEDVAVNIYL